MCQTAYEPYIDRVCYQYKDDGYIFVVLPNRSYSRDALCKYDIWL
jgi:hypothetical protein